MKSLTIVLIALLALSACSSNQPPAASTPSPAPAAPAAAPNEMAAVTTLRGIIRAQRDYFQRNRRYALDFDELTAAHFLSAEPKASDLGYEVRMRPSADASRYSLSAIPSSPGPTARYLFADQAGMIYGDAEREATSASPKVAEEL